jgi:hypothetical protein
MPAAGRGQPLSRLSRRPAIHAASRPSGPGSRNFSPWCPQLSSYLDRAVCCTRRLRDSDSFGVSDSEIPEAGFSVPRLVHASSLIAREQNKEAGPRNRNDLSGRSLGTGALYESSATAKLM